MMACAENREIACLQGINANKVFWVTMAVGCGLCGIAGALVVPVLSASTAMGSTMFLKAMLVVLVGGTGSMAGALLAAFLVGIVESFAFQYVESFRLPWSSLSSPCSSTSARGACSASLCRFPASSGPGRFSCLSQTGYGWASY